MPYDTQLTPEEERRFQAWARSIGHEGDTVDYDLRGAWKAQQRASDNGHFPDTYKKPNHPTFSDESIYSTPENPGGRWADAGNGVWNFWASPANLRGRTLGDLMNYFRAVEPDANLIAPLDYKLPPGKK